MIHLCYKHLLQPFKMSTDKINILSVENAQEYYKIVQLLMLDSQENDLCFYKDLQELNKIAKEFIFSPFAIDFSSKKIQNLLIKKLQEEFYNSTLLPDFQSLQSQAVKFILDLTANAFVDIVFEDEFALPDLIKLLNLRIKENEQDLIGRIADYVTLLSELKKMDLIIFVGLKPFLSEEQEKSLLQHCSYLDVTVLFIE